MKESRRLELQAQLDQAVSNNDPALADANTARTYFPRSRHELRQSRKHQHQSDWNELLMDKVTHDEDLA